MNLRHLLLSTSILLFSSLFSAHAATASYEAAAEIATARGVNLESIVAEPNMRDEETWPDINSELSNNLSQAQSNGQGTPSSRLFWGLAQFTKETGIKVRLPASNSGQFRPEGISNLTNAEIEDILLQLVRFKPYAIALNLNSPGRKVETIKLYKSFQYENAGGYNEGRSFVLKPDSLDLRTLVHEMLHSIDPYERQAEHTRSCMKIVFGKDIFTQSISPRLKAKKLEDHISRNSTIARDDNASSGRLDQIRKEGLFLECFAVLGQNSLDQLSNPGSDKQLFYRFIASLELNHPAYRTPEFVALLKEIAEKGSQISEEDANRYSKILRGFWLAVKQGDVALNNVSDDAKPELKRAHKILLEDGFPRPKSWGER
jgi:hypothetical protein